MALTRNKPNKKTVESNTKHKQKKSQVKKATNREASEHNELETSVDVVIDGAESSNWDSSNSDSESDANHLKRKVKH